MIPEASSVESLKISRMIGDDSARKPTAQGIVRIIV